MFASIERNDTVSVLIDQRYLIGVGIEDALSDVCDIRIERGSPFEGVEKEFFRHAAGNKSQASFKLGGILSSLFFRRQAAVRIAWLVGIVAIGQRVVCDAAGNRTRNNKRTAA